ncbi:MAG: PAS domain-containing protein, partial [Sedimentisphaerales bacterium]|nr:PAS domain-containing protein [Sedimentisphaerales bacterium]
MSGGILEARRRIVQRIKDMTIRQKLLAVIMLTGTLALILAGSVFIAYQYINARQNLVRALQTQAAMIATNARAAVQFQDQKDAASLLEAFNVQPSVLYAWILTNNQQVLARYTRPGVPIDTPLVIGAFDPNGYQFTGDLVVVSKPVVLDGEVLGTVRLCSTLEPVKRMFRANLATVLAVIGIALVVAYLVSSKLQVVVSRPILELAEVAKTVSERQQYSVRATKRGNDEIGLLIDTFNQMLGQIQIRDQALVAANEQLEQRVQERTEELRKANEQLRLEMEQRQKAEEAMRMRAERIIRHQTALLKLSKLGQAELDAAFHSITEEVAKTLDVQRVGIWLLDQSGQMLVCRNQFTLNDGLHSSGEQFSTKDYPRYVQALEVSRIVAADDAAKDQRTREFADGYLAKYGIISMMDVPLRLHGKLVGVVCQEDTRPRQWTLEEQDFAASVADTIVLRLETAERQRAQQALRESEHRYRNLLRNLPQKIFYKDIDCVYLLCNESYAEDLGLASPDQIRGKTDYDFFPYELAERYCQHDRRIMEKGLTEEIEELYVCDGKEYIVQMVKCPVRDEQGKVVGLLGIFWDITARKQAEHALEQLNKDLQMTIRDLERSNRELQDFAYVTAHDLKAPLRAVGTLSDWLYADYGDKLDQQAKEYLLRIKGR